jgi:pyruvate dehydrogenase (quinone)
MGHLGTTASVDLMSGCDTLLIVGSSDPWTEYYPEPGQARDVQIDVNARNIGAKHPVDIPLVGDATETLRALLDRLPERTDTGWRRDVERSVAVDVGSITYWYARFLTPPPCAPAHLSSTLACMGCALPYGIAAKLAAPDRPVVALVGDGAMQMSGLAELVTVAHRWREWADPRFVVLVLHNGDLAEVTWEQREMEGDPRFPDSQHVPDFPYAAYAELLGLRGIRLEKPDQLATVWQEAFAADRPCVVEAIVDPDVPLLPPRAPEEKVNKMRSGLAQEPGAERATGLLERQRDQEVN